MPKSANNTQKKKGGVTIRKIRKEDLERASELMSRLKRLNGEFDPLLKTVENINEECEASLGQVMNNEKAIVLVAADQNRIVGVVKADLVDRLYYEPQKEGAIVEFYILPEFRRGSLGNELLTVMSDLLKKMGAELITAEFPSQNEIAKRFYSKLGFRSLTNVYAKAE